MLNSLGTTTLLLAAFLGAATLEEEAADLGFPLVGLSGVDIVGSMEVVEACDCCLSQVSERAECKWAIERA